MNTKDTKVNKKTAPQQSGDPGRTPGKAEGDDVSDQEIEQKIEQQKTKDTKK